MYTGTTSDNCRNARLISHNVQMFAHGQAGEKERVHVCQRETSGCLLSAFVWILSSPMQGSALFAIAAGGYVLQLLPLLPLGATFIIPSAANNPSNKMEQHPAHNKLTPLRSLITVARILFL